MNNEMSLNDGHHSSTHLDQSNLILQLLPLCLVLSAIYFELLLFLLLFVAAAMTVSNICTVEPTKPLRDWQNLFAITRFRFIVFLFHILYYYWVEKIVRYTEDFVL